MRRDKAIAKMEPLVDSMTPTERDALITDVCRTLSVTTPHAVRDALDRLTGAVAAIPALESFVGSILQLVDRDRKAKPNQATALPALTPQAVLRELHGWQTDRAALFEALGPEKEKEEERPPVASEAPPPPPSAEYETCVSLCAMLEVEDAEAALERTEALLERTREMETHAVALALALHLRPGATLPQCVARARALSAAAERERKAAATPESEAPRTPLLDRTSAQASPSALVLSSQLETKKLQLEQLEAQNKAYREVFGRYTHQMAQMARGGGDAVASPFLVGRPGAASLEQENAYARPPAPPAPDMDD